MDSYYGHEEQNNEDFLYDVEIAKRVEQEKLAQIYQASNVLRK